MHEYDVALKSVLKRPGGHVVTAITGLIVDHWHNVELPEVRAPRADMLGETADGLLVHIELQSRNDADMALRMAEYALAIFRRYRRFPRQTVLYVGELPLRMSPELRMSAELPSTYLSFRYQLVDIRELPGEPLLSSEHLEDNVIAVLTRLSNERKAVRHILQRIAESDPALQENALSELTILAGLRTLGDVVRQETKKMPILDDIMDHDLFGPAIRQGLKQGREEGREEVLEHERHILTLQMGKRFGPVPSWAEKRVRTLTPIQIEDIAIRLLDAESLEELLN